MFSLICLSACGNSPAQLYAAGKKAMAAGDYELAYQKFTECKDYEDASGLLLAAQEGLRYDSYDPSGGFDVSQAKEILQDVFCRTWYWEDNSTFVIDESGISGYPYQLLSLVSTSSDSDSYSAEFRFLDSDFIVQLDTLPYYYTPYIQGITVTSVSDDTAYPELTDHLDDYAAEFDSYEVDARLNAYEKAHNTPRYSDKTVTDTATEFAEKQVKSGYSWRDTFYSSFKVQSSYVEYEPSDKIYTCYLNFTFYMLSSGLVDPTPYQGVFRYKDTGSNLVMLDYSIY